jgi:hypothetical protein
LHTPLHQSCNSFFETLAAEHPTLIERVPNVTQGLLVEPQPKQGTIGFTSFLGISMQSKVDPMIDD